MNIKIQQTKRIGVGIFILIIVVLTSCSQFPFGIGSDKTALEPEIQEVTSTETQLPTPQDTPTQLTTPTRTLLPSPTLSPTTRPTWTPFPTKTLRPTWTPSPTLSPTATKELGWLLRDDFSEISMAWYQGKGSNWEMGFARGGYYMIVSSNNVEITSSKSWLKIDDVRVAVDVYRQHGKGYWGISCRETVAGSYYTIFVTSDGEYGYGETRTGKVNLTILNTSSEIKTGLREVNHIIAECRGNHLRLYTNGNLLFQQEVEGIGPGWVGMMAGTMYDQETVTVIFDNIEIWGPIEGD